MLRIAISPELVQSAAYWKIYAQQSERGTYIYIPVIDEVDEWSSQNLKSFFEVDIDFGTDGFWATFDDQDDMLVFKLRWC